MPRHVLMGDPACFQIRHGANPHTRNRWGFKKKVDRVKANEQWLALKEALESHGVQVHVVPPHDSMPGLVFPANAGYVPQLDESLPFKERHFVRASLGPTRRAEQKIYEDLVLDLGFTSHRVPYQFEGQADLIQWGERFLFTYGDVIKPHVEFTFAFPPWKRCYGFRSEQRVLEYLTRWVPLEQVLQLELCQEAFYHGDTVLYGFGPEREFLLAYEAGLISTAASALQGDERVIWLSDVDAWAFAANSFQVNQGAQSILFMPSQISDELQSEVEAKGVQVVRMDVSEFYEKGGGSIKCMIGDLGEVP